MKLYVEIDMDTAEFENALAGPMAATLLREIANWCQLKERHQFAGKSVGRDNAAGKRICVVHVDGF